jgi:endonuclease-3
LTPAAILKATDDRLLPIAKMGGMRPETRVFRWREIARIATSQFDGDLGAILHQPYCQAKKALKQFPTIGDPGAEKILMFCGAAPGLPLESNGLRVLGRIGYGRVQKSYGARSVQDAIKDELPRDSDSLTRAHLLVREHGKQICRTNDPACGSCPVVDLCVYPNK